MLKKEENCACCSYFVMAKINIFSLGGLQEDGKNLYVVEINERLFILDAGLKYPTSELYGVDIIVNDILIIN